MSSPNLSIINKRIDDFRGFVQKVLPAVYDDSLSYYELLSKIMNHLNEIGSLTNETVELWNEINTWIVNDGLTENVINKMDTMINDGTFDTLINETALTDINNTVNDVKDTLHLYGQYSDVLAPIGTTRYIGHRGLSGVKPEGTIPAFIEAAEKGMWGAECDVRLTADGQWVVFHDSTVDRMTNGTGSVVDLTLAQIKQLIIDAGSNVASNPNLQIPTLEEFLITCKEYNVVPCIEIKSETYDPTYTPEQYDSLINIIRKLGLENKIIIQGSEPICTQIRNRSKAIILMLFTTTATLSSWAGDYMKTIGNVILNTDNTTISSKSDVDLCHSYGIPLSVFIVDDINRAKQLEAWGVDYIMTNRLIGGLK